MSILLSVLIFSGRKVYAQEKVLTLDNVQIQLDETTTNVFNETILTAYGYYTSGNIVQLNTLTNSETITALSNVLTSLNSDRYFVQLNEKDFGMFYLGPNGKCYWYFGELVSGLRNGRGYTILIDNNVYKVFNGIYENDLPNGQGEYAFILLKNLELWCMKGNFNGMQLNGIYNITANHPTLGQTNINLQYNDNHLATQSATFVDNNFNYQLDIDIENSCIGYSSPDDPKYKGTKNLKVPDGYELLSIVAYPSKSRIYWIYDSTTETTNGYEIFYGNNRH